MGFRRASGTMALAWALPSALWAQERAAQPLTPLQGLVGSLNLLVALGCILLLGLMQLALWALVLVAMPNWVERASRILTTHRRACWLWGLSFVLLNLILFSLGSQPGGGAAGALGVLLALALALGAQVGLAGLASLVGERVAVLLGASPSALGRLLYGGVSVYLAIWIPVVGWLVGLYCFLLSLGAFWLAFPFWSPQRAPTTPSEGENP